jgi:hypothetical protein
LKNIDIDKAILENIDIAIDIDKDNYENIDIDKDYLENIDIDIDKGILKISISISIWIRTFWVNKSTFSADLTLF